MEKYAITISRQFASMEDPLLRNCPDEWGLSFLTAILLRKLPNV